MSAVDDMLVGRTSVSNLVVYRGPLAQGDLLFAADSCEGLLILCQQID